jgi:predicted nucleotidyltransferase component of viral defense system
MKDHALELAASKEGYDAKLNCLREYLQAYILRACQEKGLFRHAAFVGGTALRFAYGLPRFSEDIDLSSVEGGRLSFSELAEYLKRELLLAGYDVELKVHASGVVRKALIRFKGLLYEANISPHSDQVIMIKVELDTRPPHGAGTETRINNQFFPVSFLIYDIPYLFAGKCHAIMTRTYTKGRDLFELGWYMTKWADLTPNIVLLRNALTQTGWKHEMPSEGTWRKLLGKVIEKISWDAVTRDVRPFLERPADLDIYSKDNILNLLITT